MKILIVDDNKKTRSLIRSIIEPFSFEIIESRNGKEAVDDFNSERPDVVLMDIEMPGMSGITAAHIITEAHPTARIFMVTMFDDQHLRDAARKAGAEYFILKENLIDLPKLINA